MYCTVLFYGLETTFIDRRHFRLQIFGRTLHCLVKNMDYVLDPWQRFVVVTRLAWTGDAMLLPTSYAAQRTLCV
jgi:hypothetical protein